VQFAVIKHVITPEQAASYVDRAYAWLEGFGKGFDRNDRSSWKVQNLPSFSKYDTVPLPTCSHWVGLQLMSVWCRGGLFNRHGSGHEQFAWDIRSEPGLIDTFAKIWGTEELVVSFGESFLPIETLTGRQTDEHRFE